MVTTCKCALCYVNRDLYIDKQFSVNVECWCARPGESICVRCNIYEKDSVFGTLCTCISTMCSLSVPVCKCECTCETGHTCVCKSLNYTICVCGRNRQYVWVPVCVIALLIGSCAAGL